MKEERMMILSMLEQGKITSEDAIKLLEALEESESLNLDETIEDKKDKIIDMDKTKEKAEEFEKVLREQGKKVESFGVDLGNKLSGIFRGVKEKGNPVNFLGGYETINTTVEKNISHLECPIIDFKSVNGGITLKSWDKDQVFIKITCQYKNGLLSKDDSFYDFYEEGNRLVFIPEFNTNIMISLNVYLPDKLYDEIYLNTSNGKIEVDKFKTNNLQCHTTNASISANNIVAQEIRLRTKNGKINLNNISSPLIEAISTNSNIILEDIDSEDLKVSTVNGRIMFSGILSNNVCGNTSNGSIEVRNISGKEITLTTSNGKILLKEINPDKISQLKLSTSNASIDAEIGEIAKNSCFDLETSLGNISLEVPNLVYKVNKQVNLGTRKIIAHSIDFNEEEEHFVFTASTSNGSIRLW